MSDILLLIKPMLFELTMAEDSKMVSYVNSNQAVTCSSKQRGYPQLRFFEYNTLCRVSPSALVRCSCRNRIFHLTCQNCPRSAAEMSRSRFYGFS